MEPSKIIGQNIMTFREINGVKQEMLAKHLGISKSRMSQIENGECRELTINRLQCIANYIGTDFFNLLSPPPAWITQTNRGFNETQLCRYYIINKHFPTA